MEHLPRARVIVSRLAKHLPSAVDRDELMQGGAIGLIDAIRRFDPSQGCSFATYAEIRIRGAVLDQLRALDWIPRTVRRSERALEDGRRAVEQREGRAAEQEEVAGQLGLSAERFEALRARLLEYRRRLGDGPLDGPSRSAPDDSAWSDSEATNPLRALDASRERRAIADAISALPQPERDIVSLLYWDELLPEDVARMLGLDVNRVRNLHTRGLLRLRSRLRALWR